jgi:S1-C subfamily serine protease
MSWDLKNLSACVVGRSSGRAGCRVMSRVVAALLLCVVVQSAVSGCTAVDKRVEKLTAAGKFEDALQELEKEGVGQTIALKPEPTPEALRAREIYQSVAETEYAKQVAAQLSVGLARKAVEVSATGVRLCQWSERLTRLELECRSRVATIDGLQAQLEFAKGPAGGRDSRREALVALQPFQQLLKDSPAVVAAWRSTQNGLLADALASLPADAAPSAPAREQLCADLVLSGVGTVAADASARALDSLARVTDAARLEGDQIAALRQCMQDLRKHAVLQRVLDRCTAILDSWAQARSHHLVMPEEASLAVMTGLHELQEAMPEQHRGGTRELLVAVLTARAQPLRVDPKTAPLAWLYLERARTLASSYPGLQTALNETVGALQRAEPFKASISIDLGPAIEPLTHRLLFVSIFDCIAQASREGVDWDWVDPVHGKPLIRVEVREGELYFPRSSDLMARVSSYLSHYEDVPNPRKEYLEQQLSSQKLSVDFAESSYESAIRSHNIYPTEWSLIGANSARTRYVIALDSYNALVREYNSTPDTIPRPVHVPYTYREGTIRAGLRTSGAVWAGDLSEEVRHAEVASDNFRVGTKFNDIIQSSRRDDSLDIAIDGESQLRRVMAVARQWVSDLDLVISRMPSSARVELPPDEALILGWLSGPFDPTERTAQQLNFPGWVTEVGVKFSYPKRLTPLETIEVEEAEVPASEEQMLSNALEAACEVTTFASSGSQINQGSGALVSADGLILTCAHVLVGPQTKVRFFEGPLKGEYDAEIVRLNDRSDVALIRARGVKSSKWLSLSSMPVERGTKIAAIASPSVGEAATAHAAVTRGEVITPIAEDWGQPRLVADVAIASGSSGGPVVDLATGRIIGVVTAVSPAEFTEVRASTATFCLAAPASKFEEWLGLKTRPSRP